MLKIYHNNRCSKSREALALLNERGLAVEVIHYLDTPPDAATLALLLQKLGYSARQLLRGQFQAGAGKAAVQAAASGSRVL
jgi:arsenate reductase